jgi:hypothetical protein
MSKDVNRQMESRLEAIRLIPDQIFDSDETVSLVLKTHLFAEYLIEGLLSEHLGDNAVPILQLELSFYQKLSLISSYELIPDYVVGSLRRLNRLRNKCVHTFNLKPNREDVFFIFEGITDELPYPDYDVEVKILLLRYMGFIAGYLAPKSWEWVD